MAGTAGHFVALVWVMTDRLNDAIPISIQAASHDRQIGLGDFAGFELCAQLKVHFVRLRDGDNSARIAIQSVDDARSSRPSRIAQLLKVVSQGCRKSARPMPFGWVNYHARRLVHDHHALVFKKNVKRYILSNRPVGWWRWQKVDGDSVPRENFESRFHWFAVDENLIFRNDLSQKHTAVAIQNQCQEHIDTFSRMLVRNDELNISIT
jgi:hypothetical protein